MLNSYASTSGPAFAYSFQAVPVVAANAPVAGANVGLAGLNTNQMPVGSTAIIGMGISNRVLLDFGSYRSGGMYTGYAYSMWPR